MENTYSWNHAMPRWGLRNVEATQRLGSPGGESLYSRGPKNNIDNESAHSHCDQREWRSFFVEKYLISKILWMLFWPEAWSHTWPPGRRSSPPGWCWSPPSQSSRHTASASVSQLSSRPPPPPSLPPGRRHTRSLGKEPSRALELPPCPESGWSPRQCWHSGQRT